MTWFKNLPGLKARFHGISLVALFFFAPFSTYAQPTPTTLGLGDIAFTGYNSSSSGGNTFSFVLLKDVEANTTITFTDKGWLAAGGFGPNEGTKTATFTTAHFCGTEFTLTSNDAGILWNVSAGSGISVFDPTDTDSLRLTTLGDQLFAYQGAAPTDGNAANWIAAIQMNGAWDADCTGANTSAKPAIFTDGVNSLSIAPEVNNAKFDCTTSVASNPDAIRAAVNDASNWLTNDMTAFDLTALCGFNTPPDLPTVTASPSPACPGEMVTLTITGNLNSATEWVLYDAQGCGISSLQTTAGNTFTVSASATTDYFVRGEGGECVAPGNCAVITVTVSDSPDCGNVATVPTLSEWGIILFGLLLLSFGSIFIYRQQFALAGSSRAAAGHHALPLWIPAILQKMPRTVLILMLPVTLLILLIYGTILPVDIPGILISSVILAYLFHYLTTRPEDL